MDVMKMRTREACQMKPVCHELLRDHHKVRFQGQVEHPDGHFQVL